MSTRNLKLRGSRKLSDRYVGPFVITAKVGPTAYRLDLSSSQALRGIHDVFHVSLLRSWSSNGMRRCAAPIELEDADQEWEISRVKAHREVSGQQQFLVGFVGFDDSEDCWISRD